MIADTRAAGQHQRAMPFYDESAEPLDADGSQGSPPFLYNDRSKVDDGKEAFLKP
jgi:hypothetical protein